MRQFALAALMQSQGYENSAGLVLTPERIGRYAPQPSRVTIIGSEIANV